MPADPAIEAAAAMLAVRDMAEDGDAYRQSPERLARAVGFIRITNPKHWARCRDTAAAAIRAYLAALDIEALAECLHDGMIRADPWEGDLAWQDETESDKDFYRYRVRELLDFIAAQPAERTAAEMRREVEE